MASPTISPLDQPITLPCGLTLQNRLAKAAMAEDLAQNSNPTTPLSTLYTHWASGNWGALLTGNVMVDSSQRGSPHDVSLPHALAASSPATALREKTLALWKTWADAIQADGTPAIMQINHPGRQAPRICRSGSTLAPSAVPLNLGPGLLYKVMSWFAFGTPKVMTQADIDETVRRFALTASLASDAGFSGMQIHAAHGYLIAQFLSPTSNKRTDGYGGSAVNRARFLREVVQAIRAAVPASFAVGIKLNSADFMGDGPGGLEDVLSQIGEIADEKLGVDFLEISGGSYENPRMMGKEYETSHTVNSTPSISSTSTSAPEKAHKQHKESEAEQRTGDAPISSRTKAREAFFLDFATEVRKRYPKLVLMVTGGFRSRAGMRDALADGACDIVGLGRPGVVTPRAPREIVLNRTVKDEEATLKMKAVQLPWLLKVLGMKGVGGGLVTLAYQKDIKKLVSFSST